MKQENAQRWAVMQVKNAYTGKWRWGVKLTNSSIIYVPQSYGLRAAVRLRNKLNKERQRPIVQVFLKG